MAYNVFLSFAMEDKDLVELFRGQAKNGRLALEFRDYSIKEPFDSKWKSNCELLINRCSLTICLVGTRTFRSEAVDWELRRSVELNKGLMAVYLSRDVLFLPKALYEFKVTPVRWVSDEIVREIQRVAV